MIGNVSPIDGGTQRTPWLSPLSEPSSSLPGGGTPGAGPLLGSGLADAVSALQINTAVGQLLQGIGGVESNKTLQMLIALLILVTLLQGPQSADSSALDDLSRLGSGSGGYMGMAYSSTTVTIEQTSFAYAATAGALDGSADPTAARGRQFDSAA